MQRMFKIQHPKSCIITYFLFIIFMWISSTVLRVYAFNKENIIRKFNRFILNSAGRYNIDWNIIALVVYTNSFAEIYVHFFLCNFVGLYIITCRYMALMLLRHIHITKYIIRSQNVRSTQCDECFFRFNNIMSLFRMADSVFSYPVFCLICNSFSQLLFICTWIIQKKNHPLEFISFLNIFILFITIIFSASSVNDLEKSAKFANFELVRSLDINERKQTKENFEILLLMCEVPSYSLSGWGCFKINRGFLLSAVGSIMTYSLLIKDL